MNENSPAKNRTSPARVVILGGGFGLCGPYGTANIAWDMRRFQAYAGRLNPWFPASVIPALSWGVTAPEISAATGLKSARNASVLSGSACALLLCRHEPDRLALDHWLRRAAGGEDHPAAARSTA